MNLKIPKRRELPRVTFKREDMVIRADFALFNPASKLTHATSFKLDGITMCGTGRRSHPVFMFAVRDCLISCRRCWALVMLSIKRKEKREWIQTQTSRSS